MSSYTSDSATATGADAVITVPTGKKYRVRSIEADIQSSSQAGNRQMGIKVSVGGKETLFVPANYQQTPSTHIYYEYGEGLIIRTPLPEVVLGPGDTIGTAINGIQSSDANAIRINVESDLV